MTIILSHLQLITRSIIISKIICIICNFFQNKFYQNNSLIDFPICKEIEFNPGAFIKLKEIQVFPIANEDVENVNGKSINPSSLEIIPEPKMINDPCVRKSDINLSGNEDFADQAIRKVRFYILRIKIKS